MSYESVARALKKLGDPTKAAFLARFFKTGKGHYGHGDRFIGITVPAQRSVAQTYTTLDLPSLDRLLASSIHEFRLTALLILVYQYKKADATTKKKIFTFYLSHTSRINNWDLVDTSAHHIVGDYLILNPAKKKILYKLARSKNLWERRIAIVATWTFIRKNQFEDTLMLAEMLLEDSEDLMHKAVGWMLREVGKRDRSILLKFLDLHAHNMPRTALRYSLEHLSPAQRIVYMKQKK